MKYLRSYIHLPSLKTRAPKKIEVYSTSTFQWDEIFISAYTSTPISDCMFYFIMHSLGEILSKINLLFFRNIWMKDLTVFLILLS